MFHDALVPFAERRDKNMKNELTRQGKYTDAVDDALIRFLKAKPKHM